MWVSCHEQVTSVCPCYHTQCDCASYLFYNLFIFFFNPFFRNLLLAYLLFSFFLSCLLTISTLSQRPYWVEINIAGGVSNAVPMLTCQSTDCGRYYSKCGPDLNVVAMREQAADHSDRMPFKLFIAVQMCLAGRDLYWQHRSVRSFRFWSLTLSAPSSPRTHTNTHTQGEGQRFRLKFDTRILEGLHSPVRKFRAFCHSGKCGFIVLHTNTHTHLQDRAYTLDAS